MCIHGGIDTLFMNACADWSISEEAGLHAWNHIIIQLKALLPALRES